LNVERFREYSLVAESGLSFAEIARRCGFTSANHLGVLFRKTFGATMSEHRNLNAPQSSSHRACSPRHTTLRNAKNNRPVTKRLFFMNDTENHN